jgi:hypothetical protein
MSNQVTRRTFLKSATVAAVASVVPTFDVHQPGVRPGTGDGKRLL